MCEVSIYIMRFMEHHGRVMVMTRLMGFIRFGAAFSTCITLLKNIQVSEF